MKAFEVIKLGNKIIGMKELNPLTLTLVNGKWYQHGILLNCNIQIK